MKKHHDVVRPVLLASRLLVGAAALWLVGAAGPAAAGSAEAGAESEETVAAPPAPAEAETPKASEPGSLYVRLLGQAAIADGDVAQFQQRHRMAEDVSGGIDELHYEKEIAEDTQLEIDGRAIAGNHDYLLGISIENEDKGWLKTGYRQFRSWYDGRGGYHRAGDVQFTVFDPQLGIDRGEAWAKGGVILPEGFLLTVGYRYLSRDGSKNSVIWGESDAVGLPEPDTRRNIVPAFHEIDESRHQVDIALARETDTSKVGGALHYEKTDFDNRRNAVRSPGEPGRERVLTERDASSSDMWGARVFGSKRLLEDKVIVSGAYAYNDLDLDLAGSRIYGANFSPAYNPTFANRQQRDEGFLDLDGETNMREHVANVAVAARPVKDLQLLSALRVRGESRHANAQFTESNVGGSPDFVSTLEELETESDTEDTSWAEDLELRYKGIDNVVLYARAQWEQNNGDFREAEIEPVAAVVNLDRRTDVDRLRQKYAAGVKAYPHRRVSLSTEYSYRLSDYDYTHRIDSTSNNPLGPEPSGNRYPAFLTSQDFATHDFNVRGTFRLPADVTFVARYDWLQTAIDTQGDQLADIESAESRAHLFGGTVTWNPANWWWTRAGANYVLSTTDTSANNYDTPVAGYFRSFDNDYVMVTGGTGFAVDAATDLDFLYTWISADNYRDLSESTVSYGSRFEEHAVGARASRRFGEHTRVTLGYGYAINDEVFAGGNYNYDVHIITTAVELQY